MSRKRKPSNKKFYSSNRKDFSLVGAKRKLTLEEENELLAVLVNRWEIRHLDEYMDNVKQFMKMNGIKTPSEDDMCNPTPIFWGRPLISRGNRAGKSWINDLIMNNKGEQKIKPSKAWVDEVAYLSIFESSKKGIYIDESELNGLPAHRYAWSIGMDLARIQSVCNPEFVIGGVKANINNL